MYYNSEDLLNFHGDRIKYMKDFLTDGWGCVREKDLLHLFNLSKMEYAQGLRFFFFLQIKVVNGNDFIAVEFYPGYQITQRYMNTLTVLTTLKQRNQKSNIIITDSTQSNVFTAKMHMIDKTKGTLRTFYVIDTQFINVPFYVLSDIIQSEINNGFAKDNRLLIIVYEDTSVEYLDIQNPVYFALLKSENNNCWVDFYDNENLQK